MSESPKASRGEPLRPTVVIVGSRGDIGTAISHALGQDGFRVVLTQRSAPKNATEHSQLPTYVLDVTKRKEVIDCFQTIESTFGPPFGLVYVAGCMREAPLALMSDDAWKEVLDVNLTGAFTCLHAVAHSMMVNGNGRIVLIGSVAARVGMPGQAAYAASKAGLEGLVRVAAVELGRFGICCNVVAPGAIDAGMFRNVSDKAIQKTVNRTTLRRLGATDEVAGVVRFLFRPEASYVTGQTVVVDGGLLAS